MKFIISVFAAFIIMAGGLVGIAEAHNGALSGDCTRATFAFTSFPSGPHSVNEKVAVNGTVTITRTFPFSGAAGTDTIPLNLTGHNVVKLDANWTADGGGSATKTYTVDCAVPAPPPPPPPVAPQPPIVEQPPAPPVIEAPPIVEVPVAPVPVGNPVPQPVTTTPAPKHKRNPGKSLGKKVGHKAKPHKKVAQCVIHGKKHSGKVCLKIKVNGLG